ncbi:MAG: hypothetical protein D6712_08860 [Chloroflexi bacterium]|nr:MAG: hypothetical protein D6712_08860 [Chloroflexota bacterium]
MLVALALHDKSTSSANTLKTDDASDVNRYFAPRPEQKRIYANIMPVFERNRAACIIEAATGTGKGRVLMAAAIEAWRRTKRPVVVCAPTIQIISQLCGEYLAITDNARQGVSLSVLLGKDNFVSETLVRAWLDDEAAPNEHEAVQAWLASGAGQVSDKTQCLHELMPQLRWLADDLREAAPTAPIAELTLSNLSSPNDSDEGNVAYCNARKQANEHAHIIVTTHMMTVLNMMRQGSNILPDFKTLIVDEAHLLASVAESAFSVSGAIRPVVRELREQAYWATKRKATVALAAIPRVIKAAEMLSEIGRNLKDDPITITDKHVRERFVLPIKMLFDAIKPLANDAPKYGKIEELLTICRLFFNETARINLSLSPSRQYPRLQTGASSLAKFFDRYWQGVSYVILASATCYVPGTSGKLNAGLLTSSLHLRKSYTNIIESKPIIPAWLYSSVKLHVSTRPEHAFPESQVKDNVELYETKLLAWCGAIADQIREIARQARGGILCLLTSYEHIEHIAENLRDYDQIIIAQQPGSFHRAFSSFKQAWAERRRAIWLATGAAWAGMDCSDTNVPADQDFMLTDLVIPKIPFGVERSLIHMRRQAYMPSAERDRALFQFRQGIGRLIRRPGLKARNLWVLDSRIELCDTSRKWLYKPFKLLLEMYPQRETL